MTKRKHNTRVRDVMEPAVASVGLDDTLDLAVVRMRERNVDAVTVVEDEKLVGMLTARELTLRTEANALVRDVVSLAVNFCLEHHTIEQAAAIMAGGRVHRLAVVAPDHRVVGVVSLQAMAGR